MSRASECKPYGCDRRATGIAVDPSSDTLGPRLKFLQDDGFGNPDYQYIALEPDRFHKWRDVGIDVPVNEAFQFLFVQRTFEAVFPLET